MVKPIHLEGTTLEGGGQLLRIAIGLSSLTKHPVRITNIRGKRSGGGGLKAQHLTSVQWLGKVSHAQLSGAELKSREISFAPDVGQTGLEDGNHQTHVKITQSTPGSVNLVLQAILPYLLFSGSTEPIRVNITGGTNVSNSPSVDYVEQVLIPMLSKIGVPFINAQVHSRGWSQGSTLLGGVTYIVTPLATALPAFYLVDRGEVNHVKATVLAPKAHKEQLQDELDVMFDQRQSALFGERDPDIEVTFDDSHHDKRFYLLLVATTTTGIKLGRDWLYDHGVRAGKIDHVISSLVKKVSSDLIAEIRHGGCVDEYMRDQLVVFQALARGRSEIYGGKGKKDDVLESSLHTKTAQWVAGEILRVEFDEQGSCEGIGFLPAKSPLDSKEEDEGLTTGFEKLEIGGPQEI